MVPGTVPIREFTIPFPRDLCLSEHQNLKDGNLDSRIFWRRSISSREFVVSPSTMATLEAAQKQWQDIQKRILPHNCSVLILELAIAVGNRQKLESQLQENISVEKVPPPPAPRKVRAALTRRQEFSTLPDDAKVFKAHGPVLLPQDLAEAKQLVSKRLEYIRGEIDRVEETLKELQSKGQRVQNEILTLSNEPVMKPA